MKHHLLDTNALWCLFESKTSYFNSADLHIKITILTYTTNIFHMKSITVKFYINVNLFIRNSLKIIVEFYEFLFSNSIYISYLLSVLSASNNFRITSIKIQIYWQMMYVKFLLNFVHSNPFVSSVPYANFIRLAPLFFKQLLLHLGNALIKFYNLPNEIIAELPDYDVFEPHHQKRLKHSIIMEVE